MEDSSPGPKKMRILCYNCCARMLVSDESDVVLLALCPLFMKHLLCQDVGGESAAVLLAVCPLWPVPAD